MAKTRINICMEDDLWRQIKEAARTHRMSASQYISQKMTSVTRDADREARLQAIRELTELELPVGPWEEMEEEIMQGKVGCIEGNA